MGHISYGTPGHSTARDTFFIEVWIPEILSNFFVYAIIRLSIYRIRCDFGMSICTAIGLPPNDHFTNTSMSFIRELLFSILIIPPSHVIFVCWKCMKLARSSVLHFDPTNNDFLLFSTYELSSFSINVEFVYNMVDSCSYILCCQC